MTSSTPFGRRGLAPARTWPAAVSASYEAPLERTPRQAKTSDRKPAKAPKADDSTPSGLIWLLFGFNGRIRRSLYWIANIAMQMVASVCLGVILWQAGLDGLKTAESSGLLSPLFAPMAWIGLALEVKRWHDRDRSWLWVFIALISIIGPLWALIECGFLDGTPGPNRFGPSPKGAVGGGAVDLSAYGIP
jgi:uncharacterized membrane protein YhaH (DUF805 family)